MLAESSGNQVTWDPNLERLVPQPYRYISNQLMSHWCCHCIIFLSTLRAPIDPCSRKHLLHWYIDGRSGYQGPGYPLRGGGGEGAGRRLHHGMPGSVCCRSEHETIFGGHLSQNMPMLKGPYAYFIPILGCNFKIKCKIYFNKFCYTRSF